MCLYNVTLCFFYQNAPSIVLDVLVLGDEDLAVVIVSEVVGVDTWTVPSIQKVENNN